MTPAGMNQYLQSAARGLLTLSWIKKGPTLVSRYGICECIDNLYIDNFMYVYADVCVFVAIFTYMYTHEPHHDFPGIVYSNVSKKYTYIYMNISMYTHVCA